VVTPTELTATEIETASASMDTPVTVVGGRYIPAEGYEFFNTLTVLDLSSGEKAYFATMDGPFPVGFSIAADQTSRDLTGFGESVPISGPAGLDAAKMLADHKAELG